MKITIENEEHQKRKSQKMKNIKKIIEIEKYRVKNIKQIIENEEIKTMKKTIENKEHQEHHRK